MNENTLIDLLQSGMLLVGSNSQNRTSPAYATELASFRRNAKAAIIQLQSGQVRVAHTDTPFHEAPKG